MSVKKVAYVNNEMLVWARSETPFRTTIDVEERVSGITAAKLDLWESGKDFPSINEAKKLAAAYKLPFATFFLKTAPERKPRKFADRRTLRGSKNIEISYELWKEINRISSDREKILEYIGDIETGSYTIPQLKKGMPINEIGASVRDFLGLVYPFANKSSYGNNAFNYYRSILEQHGIIVAQISGISLEEMRGLSIYYEPYSIIAINNKDYERAKVFSLFHELAHIVRRSSSLCLIDFNERNDDEEKICDRIAAEILLPEDSFLGVVRIVNGFDNVWDATRLQAVGDRFGTSSVAVLLRLHDLNVITEKEYHRVFRILQNEFRNNAEKRTDNTELKIKFYIKYLSQHGFLFPRTILSAHARGDISYGEMCSVLGVKREHINNIEQAVMFA